MTAPFRLRLVWESLETNLLERELFFHCGRLLVGCREEEMRMPSKPQIEIDHAKLNPNCPPKRAPKCSANSKVNTCALDALNRSCCRTGEIRASTSTSKQLPRSFPHLPQHHNNAQNRPRNRRNRPPRPSSRESLLTRWLDRRRRRIHTRQSTFNHQARPQLTRCCLRRDRGAQASSHCPLYVASICEFNTSTNAT
jgi:hypothetical protein